MTHCQFESDWVGYHVYLWHGTSVCWHTHTHIYIYIYRERERERDYKFKELCREIFLKSDIS